MKNDKKVLIVKRECLRCGYVWIPQNPNMESKCCPKCKSYKWNIARDEEGRKKLLAKGDLCG